MIPFCIMSAAAASVPKLDCCLTNSENLFQTCLFCE